MRFQGLRGSGAEYAYEVLNLVNGERTAQEIRDFVSATYGPVPLEFVVEYLRALESIKVIEAVKVTSYKKEHSNEISCDLFCAFVCDVCDER